MALEIDIIEVTTSRIHELERISKTTFVETFAEDNTAENMRQYLDQNLSAEKLREELQQPDTNFYFAQNNDEVIGFLKIHISNHHIEQTIQPALEIERIYVAQAFQGKGIGTILLNKAIAQAQMQQVKYVWLGVWEHNQKAILFYQTHGFKVYGQHEFLLGKDAQTDLLMQRFL